MREKNSTQVQVEIATWRRVLSFLTEENIMQKNRLSLALKTQTHPEFLEQAESFLSRFIRKDLLMGMLRSDLFELEKLIRMEIYPGEEISHLLGKIRHDMLLLETSFFRLMVEFSTFLSCRESKA